VTKRFKKRCVLSDVSFSVRRGEVLGLIGPNGAGKTTLFECLAGLMTADAGTLRLGDKILPPAHRKEALFYLPDAILPWAEQSVSWALHFFEKLYRPSKTTVSNLIQPAEPVSGKVGVWSKTDSVSYFDDYTVTR
jgi:ABC-2 type transport system ATP-binding protein